MDKVTYRDGRPLTGAAEVTVIQGRNGPLPTLTSFEVLWWVCLPVCLLV